MPTKGVEILQEIVNLSDEALAQFMASEEEIKQAFAQGRITLADLKQQVRACGRDIGKNNDKAKKRLASFIPFCPSELIDKSEFLDCLIKHGTANSYDYSFVVASVVRLAKDYELTIRELALVFSFRILEVRSELYDKAAAAIAQQTSWDQIEIEALPKLFYSASCALLVNQEVQEATKVISAIKDNKYLTLSFVALKDLYKAASKACHVLIYPLVVLFERHLPTYDTLIEAYYEEERYNPYSFGGDDYSLQHCDIILYQVIVWVLLRNYNEKLDLNFLAHCLRYEILTKAQADQWRDQECTAENFVNLTAQIKKRHQGHFPLDILKYLRQNSYNYGMRFHANKTDFLMLLDELKVQASKKFINLQEALDYIEKLPEFYDQLVESNKYYNGEAHYVYTALLSAYQADLSYAVLIESCRHIDANLAEPWLAEQEDALAKTPEQFADLINNTKLFGLANLLYIYWRLPSKFQNLSDLALLNIQARLAEKPLSVEQIFNSYCFQLADVSELRGVGLVCVLPKYSLDSLDQSLVFSKLKPLIAILPAKFTDYEWLLAFQKKYNYLINRLANQGDRDEESERRVELLALADELLANRYQEYAIVSQKKEADEQQQVKLDAAAVLAALLS